MWRLLQRIDRSGRNKSCSCGCHSVDFIVTKQVETIEEGKGYVRLSGG